MAKAINDTDKYSVSTAFMQTFAARAKERMEEGLSSKADVEDLDNVLHNATVENGRLILGKVVFDSIYPLVGKYALGMFTGSASAALGFSGDRDWLLDWRPYLVDMSAVPGEVRKTPVAELQKHNWLRTVDGSYALVVGITSAQKTALDGKTVLWKAGGENITTLIPGAFVSGVFQPAVVWEYIKENLATVNVKAETTYAAAIEVKLYVGSQAYSYGAYDAYHIPAPWETTETKYSVFIGRATDVYLVDGLPSDGSKTPSDSTTRLYGLTAKPVRLAGGNGFDPEDFKLARTGISPGPATTVGGKARSFFYNYPGTDSTTMGYKPTGGADCFYNNGTYPRVSQTGYGFQSLGRACNSGSAPCPVAEGGFHAYNAFLTSMEAGYGTRLVYSASMFSTGVTSNDTANATNGGVYVDSTWKAWSDGTYGSNPASGQGPLFQCMEPQVAMSIASECGVAANAEFLWNGGTWHWEKPTAAAGYGIAYPDDAAVPQMNCRIYKKISSGVASGVSYYMLRCGLMQGVNSSGDIWAYYQGGIEMVCDETSTQVNTVYLQPDQTRWAPVSSTHTLKSGKWDFEDSYIKVLDTDGKQPVKDGDGEPGVLNSGAYQSTSNWKKSRIPYTPVGNSAGTSNWFYGYQADTYLSASGKRVRREALFRGRAGDSNCSPRYLGARTPVSTSARDIGFSAQVLLG